MSVTVGQIKSAEEKMAERIAELVADGFRLAVERITEPYRMPTAMAEWLEKNNPGVDQYFAYPIGYGADAMTCHVLFKKGQMVLQFHDTLGARLMELRLHALYEKGREVLSWWPRILARASTGNRILKARRTKAKKVRKAR